MSGSLRLNGSTSGFSEITAPDVAGDQTFNLPAVGGNLVVYQQGLWTLQTNGVDAGSAGVWSRIGNQVTAWFSITFGTQSGSTAVFVSGFPYDRASNVDTVTNDAIRAAGSLSYSNKGAPRSVMFDNSTLTRINFRVVESESNLETLTGSSAINYRGFVTYITDDTTFVPINGATIS